MLAFAGAVIVEQARAERAALERRAAEIAAATNRLIDTHVLAVEQALRVLAILVPATADDRATFHRIATATAERIGKPIVLVDRDGQQLVSTRLNLDAALPRRADMAPLAPAFEADRLVVTDLVTGALTGRPVALIAVPVRRDGATAMALAAGIDPTELGDVLREAGLPDPWIAAVVDRKGIFVARSHQPETFIGNPARPELVAAATGGPMEGRFDNVTWEGVAQTNAFRRSSVTGWTAVIGIPREVLEAPQRRALALLATGGAFAGLALLLAAVFAHRIAAPVRALQGAALALAHGEPPPADEPRIRELVDVRQAFETAAAIVRERNAAKAELERTTALLAAVSASTPDLIYAKDRDSRMLIANAAVLAVIGKPLTEVQGRNDFYGDPAQATAIRANDRAVMETGETQKLEETFTSPDGVTRVFLSTKSPLRDATGAVIGLVGVSTDITDRKRREEHVELLMHELSHRTKNLLAVIQALARQLMRSSTDTADFEQKFMARIQALARAHDLLVQQHWQGAPLADVVGAQLWPFVGSERGRVTLDGPPLMLRLEAVQNLSLVLHELATNASKYGALSVPTGTIAIRWRIDGDQLVLTWCEAGGPPVTPPTRRGFGHTIIERLLAQGLESEVTLDYPPAGAQASLRIPVAQMVSEG
ncbi:hypothetical protein CCR97_24850 [Rhodoplanes elegans]|uniref:Blue-light-activated histidine kinase n=1 Tax=Rhodoplanes elegans TaxID=29408 RepID=A0A327KQ11_9BRAD|nr:HWE histidine kinase domain-containing protein [Rhodoplanes elegans]MBK5961408.1 hypothetical protein [Rhodoplanes elegans]RAI37458.1 hypothetical protein CH338_16065 [Rhodoplanes elegans]